MPHTPGHAIMTMEDDSNTEDHGKGRSLLARGFLLGERLDVRRFEQKQVLATTPLTIPAGRKGFAVLFRYGAVVLFDVGAEEEAHFLADIRSLIAEPLPTPGREESYIDLSAHADEHVDPNGTIVLREITPERLQVVADVMAKDMVLEHYEIRVAAVFDRIEPLAARLKDYDRHDFRVRDLLSQIGEVLITQHRMVGRAEVLEKPEVLWNLPELEGLFGRLEREYEVRERSKALERKLEVIGNTAQTLLDLMHTRRSLRVEWYIVLLIVFELALSLYDKLLK